MKDKFEIYDEAAVIFKWTVDDKCNNAVLEPIKIVNGYYNAVYKMFIDLENNAYVHFVEGCPGNSFGLRCKITDLKRACNSNSYNESKKIYLKSLKQFNFSLVTSDKQRLILLGIDKKNQHRQVAFDDIDLQNLTLDDMGIIVDKANNDSIRDSKNIINAKELTDHIKKSVLGQEEAIDKFVTTLWINLQSDRRNNMIIIGPTGVGKTAIIREAAKKIGRFMYKTSAAGLTEAGYKGRGIEDILTGLLIACDKDIEKASNAIVVLDEFDKIAKGKGGTIATESVQNELLTIIEDGEVLLELGNNLYSEKVLLPTKNITFIGLGNFYGITKIKDKEIGIGKNIDRKEMSYKEIKPQNLIDYGYIPDLIGRMPVIISLNSISLEILIDILKNPNNSILMDRLNILRNNGISYKITEEAYYAMASRANNTTGVRALDGIVDDTFSDIFMQVSRGINDYNYVEVTKETVSNPKKYVRKKISN